MHFVYSPTRLTLRCLIKFLNDQANRHRVEGSRGPSWPLLPATHPSLLHINTLRSVPPSVRDASESFWMHRAKWAAALFRPLFRPQATFYSFSNSWCQPGPRTGYNSSTLGQFPSVNYDTWWHLALQFTVLTFSPVATFYSNFAVFGDCLFVCYI